LRRDRKMLWSASLYIPELVGSGTELQRWSWEGEPEKARRPQKKRKEQDVICANQRSEEEEKKTWEETGRKRCDVHDCCKVERPETGNKAGDYHQWLIRAVKRDFQESRFVQGDWLAVHSHLMLSQF
jgi:hypothetical protein